MKIAIDVQPLTSGRRTGIGFYQSDLLKAAIRLAPEHKFVLNFFSLRHTGEKIGRLRELFGDDVEIRPCRWFSSPLLHRIWLILPVPYKLFFRQKADVSVFFNYYVPPYAEGKVLSVVYDTVVKDMPQTMDKRTRRALNMTLKRSIQRSDRVITISEFSRSRIMEHFGVPCEKLDVIYCGIDDASFHPGYSAGDIENCKKRFNISGRYILYLGTIEPRKNILGLIEAYKQLSGSKPDCPYLVIAGGKGWLYDEIFAKVREYGLEERILFTGYVDDNDAPLLMCGAELFCFPSFYEGFGMPPLEAMSCGTPTVVSDRSSLPEVVGNAALTADPDSPEKLAEAMEKILSDDGLRSSLREKGISQAKKFTWENSAKKFIKLIGEKS